MSWALRAFASGTPPEAAKRRGAVQPDPHPWLAAPVVATAAEAGASPDRGGAINHLALEAILIIYSIWSGIDINLHGNSTSAIGILFLPILEWRAFLLVFLVALACGWRMRPDFLKD